VFSRLIRFDVRGAVLSDPIDTADPPTVSGAARDLEAVLDALHIDRAVVVAEAGAASPRSSSRRRNRNASLRWSS
jgi:pimeloyl-ACP methyl ester carboxylesterase